MRNVKRTNFAEAAAASLCCAVIANNALVQAGQSQTIILGDLTMIWTSTQIGAIESQTPWGYIPACNQRPSAATPFYFDAPIATLRNATDPTKIDFHATSWLGMDVFTASRPDSALSDQFGHLITNPSHDADWWNWTQATHVWQNRKGLASTPSPLRDRTADSLRYKTTCTPGANTTWEDRAWIPSYYKVSLADVAKNSNLGVGDLLGFVHVETTDDSYVTQVFSIGLAYSQASDNGHKWVYCGDIIRTATNTSEGTDNIAGLAYIVKNDSFYVYYNDYPTLGWYHGNSSDTDPLWAGKRACVAAAPVAAVLAQAKTIFNSRIESIIPFYKYTGLGATGWDIYPNNAVATPNAGADLLRQGNRPLPVADLHADAAYCAPLHKYLLTVSNGPENWRAPNRQGQGAGQLWMYISDDGLNWRSRVMIDSTVPASGFIEKAHSFFVSTTPESDDCHIVGNHFFVYIPHAMPTGGYELWRRVIDIIPDPSPAVNDLLRD